jgi:hypothetical protein
MLRALAAMAPADTNQPPDGPPQDLREYDPEWGHAFASGRATASCDHENMLSHVKGPVLFTHHFRQIDPATGALMGAISDQQVRHVEHLTTTAGAPFTYRSFPHMPHSRHGHDPQTYAPPSSTGLHDSAYDAGRQALRSGEAAAAGVSANDRYLEPLAWVRL